MPATQSREELIKNCKKHRVKMDDGVTYECALVEKIGFHGLCMLFKLKRRLDCVSADRLWFKVSSEKKETIEKYGHAILVNHKYFEDRDFGHYFKHDFDEYIRKGIILCQSKEQFKEMSDSIEIELRRGDPALLALVETVSDFLGQILR